MIAATDLEHRAAAAPFYAGLVTRTLAFAVDVAIVDVTVLTVGGVVALGLSPFSLPATVRTVLLAAGAALAVAWTVGYFGWFWSVAGQTPGDRLLRLKVLHVETGRPPSMSRAVLRVGALVLSAIPFCAGFLLILFDGRRRALHDRLVGTVVVYTPSGRSPASGEVGAAAPPVASQPWNGPVSSSGP
jgi:uncharacterized RDD family membrane protein YckC